MVATTMSKTGSITDSDLYFDQVETMRREAMARFQFDRLRKTLHNAHDIVALYRQRLHDAGVVPEGVHTLDDLRRVPFICKTDPRDQYTCAMFVRPVSKLARTPASSGTTGKPTVVGYTKTDIHQDRH